MKSRFLWVLSDKAGTARRAVPVCAVLALLAGSRLLAAEPPLTSAIALYHAKHYAEAEKALRPLAAAEPANADVCYYLGMAVLHRKDATAHSDALPWLKKAAELKPDNARYLGDYGGTCMELADERQSLSLALLGRDTMERAVRLDPGYLDAREGLMEFYVEAPWPIGSSAKARTEAEEIGRHDASRGAAAWDYLGRFWSKHGKSDDARQAFQAALALRPSDKGAAGGLAALGPGQP